MTPPYRLTIRSARHVSASGHPATPSYTIEARASGLKPHGVGSDVALRCIAALTTHLPPFNAAHYHGPSRAEDIPSNHYRDEAIDTVVLLVQRATRLCAVLGFGAGNSVG